MGEGASRTMNGRMPTIGEALASSFSSLTSLVSILWF